MVFGYHFVQHFDPGFCHLVSGPPLVPEFCIGSASLLPSSPDHSVGVWRANQQPLQIGWIQSVDEEFSTIDPTIWMEVR
jgi:hypothetical protein